MPNSRVKKTRKAKGSSKPFSAENDDIDVTTEEHLAKLNSLQEKHPIVLILVYADWCGHCTTFKPVWEKYKATPGRRIPMARINEKMLKNTYVANAKIDGFPSAVISGNDKKFATFKNESGEETSAIPNLRDENAMTTLLKTDPSKLMAEQEQPQGPTENSPVPTANAKKLLTASGKKAVKEKGENNVDMSAPSPPNINHDSPLRDENNSIPPNQVKEGGSLYRSMLQLVKGIKATVSETRRKGRGRARSMKRQH